MNNPTLTQVIEDNFYSGVGYFERQIVEQIESTGLSQAATWFANQLNSALWLPYEYQGQTVWGVNTSLIPNCEPQPNSPLFSYFIKPVKNIRPYKEITIHDLYKVITSNRFASQTAHIQTLNRPAEKRKYKATSFDYFTVAGTFTQRADEYIQKRSGFIVLDFDYVDDPAALRDTLIGDENITTVLAFISPSGRGLKWVIELDLNWSHLKNFQAISNYIKHTYKLDVDSSGKDMSRACFVSYDPTCYLNPDFAL